MYMMSSLFLVVVTQPRLVVIYRRFGTKFLTKDIRNFIIWWKVRIL